RQAIRRVAAGGHDRFEVSHPDVQGKLCYFDFFLTPIRDEAGRVVFLVPEAHDITDRRSVEETLHAAEQRFRAISDVSMLGVFVTDESGNITSFSRRASEITGIGEADALAGRILEFVLPEDRVEHLFQWRRAIEERKPFAGERRFVRSDGTVSWCRFHAAPIIDGLRLLGAVGTIEDVNARKKAELALRDSEERFSRFFALSPEPFAVARFPGGEYIQVNDAWERTFGYGQSEVAGKNALDLGMWEEPDRRAKLYGDLVRRGQARSGEIRMLGKGNRLVHVQISAQVVSIGEDQYILWSTHDLSERHRMAQALRVSEERISHVFYLLPDLVTINSLEEGRFYDMNHHWEAMLGYSREEALGKTVDELGMWPDHEARRSLIRDIRESGLVRNRKIELCRKDGQVLFCETSGSIFDWQGQRLLLLVTRDMTAQRKGELARAAAEKSLRASEEMFSTIFYELPVAIAVTTSLEGRFIDVN
ncbi:MAG: PAS domain S-box protein, partial [Anaerolineae bacterium]|nr:PAS domain S-box protein [Anaerolineae bacterium]